MSWLQSVYSFFCEIFFGCSHGHLTRPFTLQSQSYKVCVDCGKQFPYSLEKMRLLHAWEVAKALPTPVTELVPAPTAPAMQEDYHHTQAIA